MRCKMGELSRKDHVNWLQIHALFMINEHGGPTMKELAQTLMVTAPTATSFVNRLVRNKLVDRKADPKNRKLVRLRITTAGRKLMQQKIKERQASMRTIISVLPTKDQNDLIRILERVLDSFPQ